MLLSHLPKKNFRNMKIVLLGNDHQQNRRKADFQEIACFEQKAKSMSH